MSLILNIETATTACSVAVSENETLLAHETLDNGYTHAENLHLFVKKTLALSGITPKDLDAVAVSRGPGSYTGLRIGTSAAKGFAFAMNIPLIAVDTLQLMTCMAVSQENKNMLYCPMIDARRMEVYTAQYNAALGMVVPPTALIVDEQALPAYGDQALCFFGDGMQKCRSLLEKLNQAFFIENIKPLAMYMPFLSYKKFKEGKTVDIATYEPFYLKEFIAGKKKKIKG
jgi:tRNA threonylcarbamoyladenosine biosynthesis protein TsaB